MDFYPLRTKLENIIVNSKKYNVMILEQATLHTSKYANEELSKLINQSYLTIACPSIADVLLHKYFEISASKSVVLGSYPSQYKELFDGNIIKVDEFMMDDEIIKIIDDALNDKKKLSEMCERLHNKVHLEHNLNNAIDDFDTIIDAILKTK
jgi:hypothetical protein